MDGFNQLHSHWLLYSSNTSEWTTVRCWNTARRAGPPMILQAEQRMLLAT